jgi:uncharacterized protein (TIGR02284 family)
MTASHQQAISTLNRLATVCCGSLEEFRAAAAQVRDPGLRVIFQDLAGQRARFAEELRVEVRLLGGEPAWGSSTSACGDGASRQVAASDSVSAADEAAIVAAALHSEDAALEAYEHALLVSLSTDTSRVVRRHRDLIRAAHGRLLTWGRMQPQNA